VSAGRGGSGTRTVIRRFTGVVGTLVVALRVGAARWARSARSRVVERLSRVVSGGSGTTLKMFMPNIVMIDFAESTDRVLMPGHTFVYSASVNAVRDLIRDGVLGEVYFVTSSRMNLGKYQQDGVVRDLAPHDLSILLYWLDERVIQVAATAQSIFQTGVAETAFMTLTFETGTTANVQISWLAPRKVRQMIVVGSRRMVQYDDTASDEPVRVYDRGMDFESPPASYGEYQLTYRTGDVVIPRIDAVEPLGLELSDFANSIRNGTEPRSTPSLGLEIAAILEATDASLERGGEPVMVQQAVAHTR